MNTGYNKTLTHSLTLCVSVAAALRRCSAGGR